MLSRPSSDAMMQELGRALAQAGLLTQTELDEVSERAMLLGTKLDEMLVTESLVKEDAILKQLSELSGLPFQRTAEFEVNPEAVDRVPARTALHYQVIPVDDENDRLTLACSRVPEATDDESLQALLGCSLRWMLCTRRDVSEAIKYYYGLGAGAVQAILGADGGRGADAAGRGEHIVATESARVTPLIYEFIEEAVLREASDIHLEPADRRLRLRYRMDGVMHDIPLPRGIQHLHRAIVSCIKVMAQLDIAERRLPHDGRIKVTVKEKEYDIRVSILPTHAGEAVNMRILNRETTLMNLHDLGMRADQEKAFEGLITLSHGIVLITGPTGSGKTTTLYSILSRIRTDDVTIVTLEDPVEYQIDGIIQVQANAKIGLDFASGLRSILRHDPDVILVGEIRDTETTDIAIRSSLTGHLVFSTLHTNDAAGAIVRLVDMGIEPFLVASSLDGVVGQRLVRRICTSCREPVTVDDVILEKVRSALPDEAGGHTFYAGRGCPECQFTGYRGRCALFEVMPVDEELKGLIVRRAVASEIRRHAVDLGMSTLRMNGWRLALDGTTTVEDVMRVTRPG